MNSKRVLAAVLCALSIGGIGYVGAQSTGIAGFNPKEEASAGRGFTVATTTRGNARALFLAETIAINGNTTAMIQAASEIDISSATIAVRASTITGEANLNIFLAWAGTPTNFPINVWVHEGGTTHLQFDPPIAARAGDSVSMFAGTPFPGGTNFLVEIVLNGTVPAAPVEPGDFLEVH